MMKNFNMLMFLHVTIMGTIMSLSANNWLTIWTGLEISIMSIMPMIPNNNFLSSEASVKYFMIQSISSSMMMLGVLLLLINSKIEYQMILTSSMMLKMGIAPFHNWILEMIESVELMIMFLLLTLMKIAPLNMISYLMFKNNLFIMTSLLVGSVFGLNQMSLRKMMCYSSIFNMSFMLASISTNSIWWFYMGTYSLMLISILFILSKMKINYINQLSLNEEKMSSKMNIWLAMLSMGGMPPMMGFMLKLMVIQMMMSSKEFLISIIMIMSSVLVMFYYLRLSFVSILFASSSMKWKAFSTVKSSSWIIMINIFMMPLLLMLKT
uniref:NADH-ubiquinone oxidoreductase chain 2 n=1 Tax=Japanagallia turriformis TaxID=3071388 RepID=A0AA50QGC7_9HEMI|nr:NADH dehydrogenase subunit 2 [Japanagallia turriformis]WMC21076.1 NADH dehydrogenase subunit 2 [Japanagallia turriformis]